LRQELQLILKIARGLSPDELPELLGEIEEVRYTAIARLSMQTPFTSSEPDQLLEVEEAAKRLSMSEDYLYRHSKDFPFTRRIGRRLLFSSLGIDRYIKQQDGLTTRRHRATLRSL
jgi:predicted DNA-binding transcriptional regulator AlpA